MNLTGGEICAHKESFRGHALLIASGPNRSRDSYLCRACNKSVGIEEGTGQPGGDERPQVENEDRNLKAEVPCCVIDS